MSKKIFILEDDVNILYALESQFAAAEFKVETSEGNEEPEEIMSRLRRFAPDFIILDVILPTIDGFDIIKKIKSEEELSDARIFIFTDISDEDNRKRSLELGADYLFFKEEFDTYEFVEKVCKIVTNRHHNDRGREDEGGDDNEDRDYLD